MSNTENAAQRYSNIDDWSSADLVAGIVEGQFAAIGAVQTASPAIAQAIDAATARLESGGRLIYIGAGTSGRIATQDAAELPPTFNWPYSRAISLMAGGDGAFTEAKEGAEDDEAAAIADLSAINLTAADVLIGVAASGRTPYTCAGLAHAKALGALTIGVYNNAGGRMGTVCEIAILIETGAEFVAGSTRMKAGTAQKVALNAISTGVMIKLGLVYRGMMVEMPATNIKLHERAIQMVADLTGADLTQSHQAFTDAGGSIKLATVMLAKSADVADAQAILDAAGGNLKAALG